MTISADGFVDWAERRPGPAFKVYNTINIGVGVVWHSMEGWYEGSLRELDNPERQASWQFSLKLDGTLVQHYPITASCWSSGNGLANTHWWSVELEGLFSMPINEEQACTAGYLIEEWEAWSGQVATRQGDLLALAFGGTLRTMLEHREVDTLATPNAGDTACPSERYAPLWAALEDDMTRKELLDTLVELHLITLDANGEPILGAQSSVASLDAFVGALDERFAAHDHDALAETACSHFHRLDTFTGPAIEIE